MPSEPYSPAEKGVPVVPMLLTLALLALALAGLVAVGLLIVSAG